MTAPDFGALPAGRDLGAPRVPMPPRHSFIVRDEVVALSSALPSAGRRFTLDVAEEALSRMVPEAIAFIATRLAESVVHRQQVAIEAAVASWLTDRAWAEPIIREAIREEVHRYVAAMLDTSDASQSAKDAT